MNKRLRTTISISQSQNSCFCFMEHLLSPAGSNMSVCLCLNVCEQTAHSSKQTAQLSTKTWRSEPCHHGQHREVQPPPGGGSNNDANLKLAPKWHATSQLRDQSHEKAQNCPKDSFLHPSFALIPGWLRPLLIGQSIIVCPSVFVPILAFNNNSNKNLIKKVRTEESLQWTWPRLSGLPP